MSTFKKIVAVKPAVTSVDEIVSLNPWKHFKVLLVDALSMEIFANLLPVYL